MLKTFFILTFFLVFTQSNSFANDPDEIVSYGPQTYGAYRKLIEIQKEKALKKMAEKTIQLEKNNSQNLTNKIGKETQPTKIGQVNGSKAVLKKEKNLKDEEIKLIESLKKKERFRDRCLEQAVCDHFFKEGEALLIQRKNEVRLNEFISRLKKMTKKECFYPEAESLETVITDRFRVCIKSDVKKRGRADKILLGVHNSRFIQGRQFTQSAELLETLSESTQDLFRKDPEDEASLPYVLKVSVGERKSIFNNNDVLCVERKEHKLEKSDATVDSDNDTQKTDVVYRLNEYASARLGELTEERLGKKIGVSSCGGEVKKITLDAIVKSGVVMMSGLIPAEIDCIREDQWCDSQKSKK